MRLIFTGLSKISLIVSFLFLLSLASNSLLSQVSDSTVVYKKIAFICNIKPGSRPDTVISVANYDRYFIPYCIKWGYVTPDTSNKMTKFNYPNWTSLKAALNVSKFNSDTLNDLQFVIWGKLKIDSNTYKDTATSLMVFWSQGLQNDTVVDLTQIDSISLTPIKGMKLQMNQQFTDCKIRDFSFVPTYVFNCSFPSGLSRKPLIEAELPKPIIKVYPNPANNFITIEMMNLISGTYKFQVFDLNGQSIIEQNIDISTTTNVTKMIDFENLATGLYYLRITNQIEFLGTYPIIIIK